MNRSAPFLASILSAFALSACAALAPPVPINVASANPDLGAILPSGMNLKDDAIILSFSGGGARAAAFSYGVLRGLREMPARAGGSLLDRVALVSGVSGGSITASWYGLHGPEGLDGFRAAYLDKDWQSQIQDNPVSPFNWISLAGGGMNSAASLTDWLDQNIYHGARMAELRRPGRPAVLINATDLYGRVPFIFAPEAFRALCSDLGSVRVADAVGASMAVPLAFRPVVAQAFPSACAAPLPTWATNAASQRGGALGVQMIADSYSAYRDPKRLGYVHLFDGGVIDNFGVSALALARASSDTPFGPLEPADAVRLRHLTFLIVDAGQSLGGGWALTLKGPDGAEIGDSTVGSAMDASKRAFYDGFLATVRDWQGSLRDWRCTLPKAEIVRLRGSAQGWHCDDIALTIDIVRFADLPPAQRDELSAVETKVSLPAQIIDRLIAGGEAAARANPSMRELQAKTVATSNR